MPTSAGFPDALKRLERLLEVSERTRRWAIRVQLGLESVRLLPDLGLGALSTWRLTDKDNFLSRSRFGTAADVINRSHAERIYAIDRRSFEVAAAAAFERRAGPDHSLLIVELALARTPPRRSVRDGTRAYEGAIVLLDNLHDQQYRAAASTDIWLDYCQGVEPDDCDALGFERVQGDDDSPAFRRADPGAGERAAPWFRRVVTRMLET